MTLKVRRIVTGHDEFGMVLSFPTRSSVLCRAAWARTSRAARFGPRIPCQSTIRWKRRSRNESVSSRNTTMSATARAPQYGSGVKRYPCLREIVRPFALRRRQCDCLSSPSEPGPPQRRSRPGTRTQARSKSGNAIGSPCGHGRASAAIRPYNRRRNTSGTSDVGIFGRYTELPLDKMTVEQKTAYEFAVKQYGEVPGPYKIWLQNPKSPSRKF
jgi:hypothetical protein